MASEIAQQAFQIRERLTSPGAPFELIQIERDGHTMPAYRNAFQSLPQLINAGREHGPKEFMVYQGDRWTFDRFYAAVDALAGRLQADLHIKAGDRVAIAMRNRPEWAVAFAALALIGAVPVPLNSFGLQEELMHNLRDVLPTWLICDADRFARVESVLHKLDCRPIVVDGQGGQADWAQLIAAGAPAVQLPQLAPLDPALILFTSGATSHAKGVLSSQRAVCQAMFNIDFIGAISAMVSPDAVAALMAKGLQPTTLMAVPLFHVSGLHAQLLSSLRHGRRLVFMHRWDPAEALRLIQAEKITQFNGAPAMVQQLISQPGFDDPAITGTIGGLGFGGAGLPQRLIEDVLTRRPNSLSGIGFGMTETNGVGAGASGRLFESNPKSAGVPSPIIDIRIADPDGQPLPPGEAGEIWMRGISVMDGYWARPEETEHAVTHGWLRTGDIGIIDDSGCLRVVDRIKDVINRSGEKISAAEVESCVLQHPEVVEVAVFARPDDTTGEAVVAVVVTAPDARVSPDDIKRHVSAHLAAYKVPSDVVLRTEHLPRNPAGKVLKNPLKQAFLTA